MERSRQSDARSPRGAHCQVGGAGLQRSPTQGELRLREVTPAVTMGGGQGWLVRAGPAGRRGAGCHRRGRAIVTHSAGGTPPCRAGGWQWHGGAGAGYGAHGDNVPVEAGAADGDKRPPCFRCWQAASRQRAGRGLNASSVPPGVGGEMGGSGWQRAPRTWPGCPGGAGQSPAAAPHPARQHLSILSLFFPLSPGQQYGAGTPVMP